MPIKRHVIFTNWQSIPPGYVATEDEQLVARAREAYDLIKAHLELDDEHFAAASRVPVDNVVDARAALLHQLAAFGPDPAGGDARPLPAVRNVPSPGAGWMPEVLL
jgi:hypothetical protein